MSVVNINTAKGLRRSDNGSYRILCEAKSRAKLCTFPASDARLESEFVYKTVPLGIASHAGACARPAHTNRKPVRLIIARTPETWEKAPGYLLTHYNDTLSCGHQVVTHSFEASKKRRGCQECLDALAVPLPIKEAA